MSACRAVAGTESHAERLCASGGPNSIGEYFRRVLDRFSSMVGLLHALHNPLVQHLQPGGMVHCASLLALPIERFKQHGDGTSTTSLCNFKAENFGHVAASFRFAVPSKVEWAPTTFVPGAQCRACQIGQLNNQSAIAVWFEDGEEDSGDMREGDDERELDHGDHDGISTIMGGQEL